MQVVWPWASARVCSEWASRWSCSPASGSGGDSSNPVTGQQPPKYRHHDVTLSLTLKQARALHGMVQRMVDLVERTQDIERLAIGKALGKLREALQVTIDKAEER